MKNLRIKIGKNSWGHFRLGSYISMIAILAALGVDRLGERLGTPDALWVEVVKWICLALFVGDIFRTWMKLSPRKRWERVMGCGITAGGAFLRCAFVIWLRSRDTEPLGVLITMGGFLLLIGAGGWWMWRRTCRELNSRILERKFQRKKRIL